MSLLSVIDNHDGTATAIIGGGPPSSSFDLYAAALAESLPAWEVIDSIDTDPAGDGDVTFALADGVYFFAIEGIDNGVRLAVLNAAGSLPTRIRAAIVAEIQALGIPFAEYAEQWTPDETNLQFPALVATVSNVMETNESQSNLTEDIGYPTRLMICDRQDKLDHSELPAYEQWRTLIDTHFAGRQLALPESLICRVEYDTIVDPNAPQFQYMVSHLIIRAVARRHRS